MENRGGWVDDPYGRYPRRYFNGEEWTDQVQVATGEVVTETSAAVETDPPAEPSPDTPSEPLSVEHENPKGKSKKEFRRYRYRSSFDAQRHWGDYRR